MIVNKFYEICVLILILDYRQGRNLLLLIVLLTSLVKVSHSSMLLFFDNLVDCKYDISIIYCHLQESGEDSETEEDQEAREAKEKQLEVAVKYVYS